MTRYRESVSTPPENASADTVTSAEIPNDDPVGLLPDRLPVAATNATARTSDCGGVQGIRADSPPLSSGPAQKGRWLMVDPRGMVQIAIG